MTASSHNKCFIKNANGKRRSKWVEDTSGKPVRCPLFWFPTKFTAACQSGSELRGPAIGDRRLTLMFCSRSKSEPPNSSDELVLQALSTTYELIGRAGENSASCDCRHHIKFNTTALSVTLPITQQIEAYFYFFFCYFLIFFHPSQGMIHYTKCTLALNLGTDNTNNLGNLYCWCPC